MTNRSWGWTEGSISMATAPKCWGGRYSFPLIVPLTLDTYLIILCVIEEASRTIFESSIWLTWDRTPLSQTIGEHTNHYFSGPVIRVCASLPIILKCVRCDIMFIFKRSRAGFNTVFFIHNWLSLLSEVI